jgi:putative transposase
LPILKEEREMGRKQRQFIAGQSYHITHRGNARQQIFFTDSDRDKYIECLQRASLAQNCLIHSWVLMNNHVHLILSQNKDGSISKFIMHAHGAYGSYLNRAQRIDGKVWNHRFFAGDAMDDSYLLTCMAYIDLNPIRAGFCSRPEQWPWSSHRMLALGRKDKITTPHYVYYSLMGVDHKRYYEYTKLVESFNFQYRKLQESIEWQALKPKMDRL